MFRHFQLFISYSAIFKPFSAILFLLFSFKLSNVSIPTHFQKEMHFLVMNNSWFQTKLPVVMYFTCRTCRVAVWPPSCRVSRCSACDRRSLWCARCGRAPEHLGWTPWCSRRTSCSILDTSPRPHPPSYESASLDSRASPASHWWPEQEAMGLVYMFLTVYVELIILSHFTHLNWKQSGGR